MAWQAQSPLMDYQVALTRVGGDRELLREIAEIFVDDYPRVLAEVREGASRGDAKAVERAAHGLKGSVANFGAPAATESALKIELLGRAGDLRDLPSHLQELETLLTCLRQELTEI